MKIRTTLTLLYGSLCFALCYLPLALSAQYFNPGTDPASVRWHQLKSRHYKIIYPENLDSQAVYIANALEYFRGPGSASLEVLPSKWPVILHNRTVVSNGYTPYAPKRIELITTPPQDNESTYAQNWIDQLVIHEFRHTVQYASVNRGLTKAFTYILGQQALPAVLGLFVPWWFIEGDAVVTETANSHTGRGRVPANEMKLRAQFLEKGIYSYDKAVNGSFRDFTPNHYELGYLLVGHTRAEFGRETWSRVMRKTGNIPLMMVPFSNTLYKETGFGKSRLYDHITKNLEQTWKTADSSLHPTFFSSGLRSADRFYTNRTRPAVLDDGRIIVLKNSIDDIPRIMIIDSAGIEKILLNPGQMVDENLSSAGNLLCWAELAYDARWYYRTYSVIRVLDLESGKIKQITHKTRYFSPDLSRDGKHIATVYIDEDNQYFISILDALNGEPVNQFPVPNNHFPDYPSWSNDGRQIAVILTGDEGKCLAVADASTGKFEIVLPFTYTEISKPYFSDPYIFFTGSYTGTDNIFAFNYETKELYQVTSSRFGAADVTVSPDGESLYYIDYTSDGWAVATVSLNPESWTVYDSRATYRWELAEQLADQENFIFHSGDVPDSAYTIKPYSKGLNLFNFHSWAPLSIDASNMDVNPGVSFLSQNLLGTSVFETGYAYDLNEESGKYYIKYSFEGLYPAFDLETDFGLRKDVHTDTAGNKINYKYHELNLSTGLRVPLNWSIRSWYVGIQPFAGYTYKYLRLDPDSELKFTKDRINSLDYRLFLYAQSRQSSRDLQPRLGQLLELNYRHTPFDGDTANSIFAAEALIYLPGLAKHHGFKVYGGYQYRFAEYFRYSNLINIPRGYSGIFTDEAVSGSISYALPLGYPDWNVGPVIYFKRIKAGLFYDFMFDLEQEPYPYYQSMGLDLTFDFHLFRWFVPLEAGLRTIYLPDGNRFEFEFLYSLNIGELY